MIDLVICGPDLSGTSTQIEDLTKFFKLDGLTVRDLRGGEIDALFHAKRFIEINSQYSSFLDYCNNSTKDEISNFLYQAYLLQEKPASMVDNGISEYIDPNSADVWIMEEPPRRGAGLENRFIEQNPSKWGIEPDQVMAALDHQGYRKGEFLRFRGPLREAGKITARSRSEESIPYQAHSKKHLPNGINLTKCLGLPGNKIAFANHPTHIFIVCGSKDWTEKDYIELRNQRSKGRILDDNEKDTGYQVLVNSRYATDWIEKMYEKACEMHGGQVPVFERFNIYDSREEIAIQMHTKIKQIPCYKALFNPAS